MARQSLCGDNEIAIVECAVEDKLVAICTGKLQPTRASTQYRYGVPGRVEFSYPAMLGNDFNNMHYWTIRYAGGGESRIEFYSGGYLYAVYGRVTRTRFAADGRHDARIERGVLVTRAGEDVFDKRCSEELTPMNEELARNMFGSDR